MTMERFVGTATRLAGEFNLSEPELLEPGYAGELAHELDAVVDALDSALDFKDGRALREWWGLMGDMTPVQAVEAVAMHGDIYDIKYNQQLAAGWSTPEDTLAITYTPVAA